MAQLRKPKVKKLKISSETLNSQRTPLRSSLKSQILLGQNQKYIIFFELELYFSRLQCYPSQTKRIVEQIFQFFLFLALCNPLIYVEIMLVVYIHLGIFQRPLVTKVRASYTYIVSFAESILHRESVSFIKELWSKAVDTEVLLLLST